jgi:hypothetical protein
MNTLTVNSRKQDLLERAAMYRHTPIFLPDAMKYVRGVLHEPIGFKDYDSTKESIVDAKELYDLDDSSWLTVNHYNALVLNTSNMLIADVDFGDGRLDRHAGAKDWQEVCRNLGELHLLDKEHEHVNFEDFNFADQSYRVYRTHSGCRVICTSIAVPWGYDGWIARRFMQFLRSDPAYIELCGVQKCYRARLTPKPWRDKGDGRCVCHLVSTAGQKSPIAFELEEQLKLHDELTLPEHEWAELA